MISKDLITHYSGLMSKEEGKQRSIFSITLFFTIFLIIILVLLIGLKITNSKPLIESRVFQQCENFTKLLENETLLEVFGQRECYSVMKKHESFFFYSCFFIGFIGLVFTFLLQATIWLSICVYRKYREFYLKEIERFNKEFLKSTEREKCEKAELKEKEKDEEQIDEEEYIEKKLSDDRLDLFGYGKLKKIKIIERGSWFFCWEEMSFEVFYKVLLGPESYIQCCPGTEMIFWFISTLIWIFWLLVCICLTVDYYSSRTIFC